MVAPVIILGVGAWWYSHPGRYFTIRELTTTSTGLPNAVLNPSVWWNLHRLCVVALDPLRESLGTPLRVNSAYRSPAVNDAVGGVHDSYHMKGLAADVEADGYTAQELHDRCVDLGLDLAENIVEADGHLHIAIKG